jgi:hypothetical protein
MELGELQPRNQLTPEDDAEIWVSYFNGATQMALAELYGVTQPIISRAIARYRRAHGVESKEEARELDLSRVEALIETHWRKAIQDKSLERGKFVGKMIELRARVLGYEAPTKVEHSGQIEHTASPELAAAMEVIRERNQQLHAALTSAAEELLIPEDDIEEAVVVHDDDGTRSPG